MLGSRPKVVALWLSDTSVVSFPVVRDRCQSPAADVVLNTLIVSAIFFGWTGVAVLARVFPNFSALFLPLPGLAAISGFAAA